MKMFKWIKLLFLTFDGAGVNLYNPKCNLMKFASYIETRRVKRHVTKDVGTRAHMWY